MLYTLNIYFKYMKKKEKKENPSCLCLLWAEPSEPWHLLVANWGRQGGSSLQGLEHSSTSLKFSLESLSPPSHCSNPTQFHHLLNLVPDCIFLRKAIYYCHRFIHSPEPVLPGPDLSRLSHTCIILVGAQVCIALPAPAPLLAPSGSLWHTKEAVFSPFFWIRSPEARHQASWTNLILLMNLTIHCYSVTWAQLFLPFQTALSCALEWTGAEVLRSWSHMLFPTSLPLAMLWWTLNSSTSPLCCRAFLGLADILPQSWSLWLYAHSNY